MAKHKRPLDIWTTYNGHSGIDYPYPSWTPVPATGSGYVSARGSNDRGGNFAYVIYDDGQVDGFFHLPDHSGPGQGSRVSEGTTVCYVGNTGNSTGPHLHNEVEYPQGNRREPPDYWNCVLQGEGQYVGGGSSTTPPAGNQRVVGVNPANGRSDPSTAHPATQQLDPGTVATFDGWVHGENVQGQTVWFRGAYSGDWFWSGGFTDTGTHDLADLNDVPPPPAYTFTAFSAVVTEVVPCATTNYESGAGGTRFPAAQTDVVLHDYGTYNQDTYSGTVSWFQNPAAYTSAHFVVSGAHITQMVSLDDRAFHAGADGNWFVGIEIDPVVGQPVGTPNRQETIDSANVLLEALRAHYGVEKFVYHRHSEFMSTSCGDDIHFEDYPQDVPPLPGPGPLDPAQYPVLWSVKGELDHAFGDA